MILAGKIAQGEHLSKHRDRKVPILVDQSRSLKRAFRQTDLSISTLTLLLPAKVLFGPKVVANPFVKQRYEKNGEKRGYYSRTQRQSFFFSRAWMKNGRP